jgi:hypothetical protein
MASNETEKFLATIWELAAKWPADPESGEPSDVAANVFRNVPVSRETRQRIYSACTDCDLKLNILDGCRGFQRDDATIRLGLQDTDDACREWAYSMLGYVRFSQVEELIQKGDKAALSGLARNLSVPKPALEEIRGWFEEHGPTNYLVLYQISSTVADRQEETHEQEETDEQKAQESQPVMDLETRFRWYQRMDWLAEKTIRHFPCFMERFFLGSSCISSVYSFGYCGSPAIRRVPRARKPRPMAGRKGKTKGD